MGGHEKAERSCSGGGGGGCGGGGDCDDLGCYEPHLVAVEVSDIVHVVDSQNFET